MRSFLKALMLVSVLLVLVIVALPFVVPVDYYKQNILDYVQKKTGLVVKLDKASLSLWPRLGIKLHHLGVGYADKQVPYLRADHAKVSIEWAPLLKRKLVVHQLEVIGGHLFFKNFNTADIKNFDLLLKDYVNTDQAASGALTLKGAMASAIKEVSATSDFTFYHSEKKIVLEKLKGQLDQISFKGRLSHEIEKQKMDADVFFSKIPFEKISRLAKLPNDVQGLGDLHVKAQGLLNDLKGSVDLSSQNLGLTIPGKLNLNRQPLIIKGLFYKKLDSFGFDSQKISIGSQDIVLKAKSSLSEMTADVSLTPFKTDFWEKHLPSLKQMDIKSPFDLFLKTTGRSGTFSTTGQLLANHFNFFDKKLQNLKINFVHQAEKFKVQDLQAKIFDGEIFGTATLDMSRAAWPLLFDMNLKNVDMKQLENTGKILGGRGDLKINGSMEAASSAKMDQTIQSKGSLVVRQLSVRGLNFFSKLAESDVWKISDRLPQLRGIAGRIKSLDDNLRDMTGQFEIKNGKLLLPKIEMLSALSSVNFSGTLSVLSELDLKGVMRLPSGTLKRIINHPTIEKALIKDGFLDIPFKVSGLTSAPNVLPDLSLIQKRLSKVILNVVSDQVKDKLQDEIKDRVQEQLGDKIRDKTKKQVGDNIQDKLKEKIMEQLEGNKSNKVKPQK